MIRILFGKLTYSSHCELNSYWKEDEKMGSREDAKKWNVEEVSAVVVDAAFHIHKELGPGLLESVYEIVLARTLERRGLKVVRQRVVAFEFDGMRFEEGLRLDLLVNECLVVELKSTETLAAVHYKQVLTYLRLLHLPLGLLINFGTATFKEGIKRIVNNHNDFASSRLRVNPESQAIENSAVNIPQAE